MSRLAGRNGRLYVGIASGGTAEPVAYLKSWSLKFATDKYEVTALGDSNKTYVSGLPDCQGDYKGFFDDSTEQLYTAASDGVARKWYLYPTTSTETLYWFGTAFFDFNIDGDVGGPINIDGTFAAATATSKNSS